MQEKAGEILFEPQIQNPKSKIQDPSSLPPIAHQDSVQHRGRKCLEYCHDVAAFSVV
jgi:hypothetical protein